MDFSFQTKSLRIYPLPYIDFRIGPQHIFHVQDSMSKLQADHPDFKEYKIRSALERMLVSMAFADIYDKQDQFLAADLESFAFQKDFDFTHGKNRVSLSIGKVNEKIDETGTSVPFRTSVRAIKAAKADWFVMAAIQMPHIHLVGWMGAEDLKPFIKGYAAHVYAGCPKLKSMHELPLENKRRKGVFV